MYRSFYRQPADVRELTEALCMYARLVGWLTSSTRT